MNSTEMRDAIAKALGIDPTQIQVVDVDAAPQISEDGYFDFSATPTGHTATDELAAEMAKVDAMTGGYPPISGTWAQSQKEKEDLAFENMNTPKAPLVNALNANDALRQQITNLQVANRELATRNDRQAATINGLHEKIAGGEAIAGLKATRERFLSDVILANLLLAEIFDCHPAYDGAFDEDVTETIGDRIEAIKGHIVKLRDLVLRNL